MEDAEQLVREVLSAMGFGAEAVPRADGKRADLRVTDAGSTYFVEVKHKQDDPKPLRDAATRMARGEVVSSASQMGHNNRISGILKHGRDQVQATPDAAEAYRLIWYHVDGIDQDLRWKQAFATFYGRVHLFQKEPRGTGISECYYFDYSAAASMPSIDAMILSGNGGVLLCLNEFSPQIDHFCRSRLHDQFAEHKGVVDPRKLAAEGSIVVCRSNVPRKDDRVVLQALREQTGILYDVIRFTRHAASAAVDPMP